MKYKVEITVTGEYIIDTDKDSVYYGEGLTAQEMMDMDIDNSKNYPQELFDVCDNIKATGKLTKEE
jgi:hypothetical protein